MAIIRPNADPLPVGNMHINFVINQVIRKDTDRKEWEAYSHDMKYSINGGSNVINPKYNLNIWIVELPPGLGGYATYPSSSSEHQGAVLLTSRISSESGISMTITHEIGHWLKLRHTFQGGCNDDDGVSDTPAQEGKNYECPHNGQGP
eukprot:193005_1